MLNFAKFQPGEIFGVLSFFSDFPREDSVISKEFSSVLELKKQDFLAVIKENPSDYVIKIILNCVDFYIFLEYILLISGSNQILWQFCKIKDVQHRIYIIFFHSFIQRYFIERI